MAFGISLVDPRMRRVARTPLSERGTYEPDTPQVSMFFCALSKASRP
jgi:hypothetical protein